MVVNLVRLEFYDLAELLDCESQHLRGLHSALHIADRAKIDSAEQFARVQVRGIALYNLLRFGNGVANVSGFEIQFGKTGI